MLKSAAFVLLFLGIGIGPVLSARGDVPSPRNEVIRDQSPGYAATEIGTRALKIALVGDSLSVPFHYTTFFDNSRMIHRNRRGGWFYGSPASLFEEISASKKVPVEVMNLAIAGSWIKERPYSLSTRMFQMDSMDRQVTRILSEEHFPNLILVWQGHNDADWLFAAKGLRLPEDRWKAFRQELPRTVTEDLRAQLVRLITRARKTEYPVTIVVFGLLDARSALSTRKFVEQRKKTDPAAYPFLQAAREGFPSLSGQFEHETIAVFDDLSRRWQDMVQELNGDLKNDAKPTQVLFSDALTRVELTPEKVSAEDGLHLSLPAGHRAVTEAAMSELERQDLFRFLLR